MGFRFSRRVSILPGLRLNLSGSGVSLSAGVRGAHMTFGPRGTYASVGIPGTGLSYRQRLGGGRSHARSCAPTEQDIQQTGDRLNDDLAMKLAREGRQTVSLTPEEARRYLADPRFTLTDPDTGRRMTAAQVEARFKANELKEKIENLQVQLRCEAEDYQHLLNFWKPLPGIGSVDDWKNALSKHPFESKLPPPVAPNLELQRIALLDELTAKHRASGVEKFLPEFVARKTAEKEMATAWLERQSELQAQFGEATRQYQQQLAAEAAAWDKAEIKRINWIGKLLTGDLEEIHHTVAEVLEGLRLPFHTHCDFFLKDSNSVYLHLDLPEMEDVIPATTKEISKEGQTREVRRLKADRNADYTHLVVGESLFLAAEVFSYLPLAQIVQLAAYTQRPRVRESDPVDTYLVDVSFRRAAVIAFAQTEENLVSFITKQGGRFKIGDDGALGRIDPPSWLSHEDYRDLTASGSERSDDHGAQT